MKRLIAVCLVLLLCAAGASAQIYTWEDMITIEFPDGWETLVDDANNTADYQNLVTVFDVEAADGLNITLEMNSFADRAGEYLSKLDEAGTQQYIERVLAERAAEQARYMDTVLTSVDGIPFIIFTGTTQFGPFYQAETCIDGMVISFYGYAYPDESFADSKNRAWRPADFALFEQIVESFTLV